METPTRRLRSTNFHYDDERLRFAIRASGLNTGLFARQIGLDNSEELHQILSGKEPLNASIAGRIHNRYPQIDLGWLLRGCVGSE